jgi:hypothetical protein
VFIGYSFEGEGRIDFGASLSNAMLGVADDAL